MSVKEARVHPPTFNTLILEEFFELGKQETESPFLTPSSRQWGANLTLKSSFLAAFFLLLSFVLSYFPAVIALSHFSLLLVYFLVGIPSLIESIEDLTNLNVNIDILMTLAAFSSVLIGSGMEGGLLLVLFALSGSMEDFVTGKAKEDISSLHKLSPTQACVIKNDGTLVDQSVRDISIGTKILIKSGQLVPLDGVITEGISSINLAHLTGEAMPLKRQVGDEVPAGARNMEGALTIEVTRTSGDSTVARIIQMVMQAQEERPVLQRWFDRLSRRYAIVIMALSGLFALLLPWILPIPYLGFEGSFYRSLAFLIAASPCALIIAIPIAYLSAVGVCARQGILLKGGVVLDALAQCRAIAFDKTGTLTTGLLILTGIQSADRAEPAEISEALSIAYALEKNAIHPIAKALVVYGEEQKLPVISITNFRSIPGYGLEAMTLSSKGSVATYIGHIDYIFKQLTPSQQEAIQILIEKAQKQGELIAVLLIGEKLFLLSFADALRPGIRETIKGLRLQDLRIVMLTGDHESGAKRIAGELGISEYYADLRPEDKLQHVSKLATTEGLAMIGDGVNDAPALARATVGICMGKIGSTAAIDAADIVLLQDNIELLGWLMKKSRDTQRIVRQNLILASLVIIAASLPALAGFVPLWLAVIMHEGGTVLVGLNGLRLLQK